MSLIFSKIVLRCYFYCIVLYRTCEKIRKSKIAILIFSEIRIEARALDLFLSSRATSVHSWQFPFLVKYVYT